MPLAYAAPPAATTLHRRAAPSPARSVCQPRGRERSIRAVAVVTVKKRPARQRRVEARDRRARRPDAATKIRPSSADAIAVTGFREAAATGTKSGSGVPLLESAPRIRATHPDQQPAIGLRFQGEVQTLWAPSARDRRATPGPPKAMSNAPDTVTPTTAQPGIRCLSRRLPACERAISQRRRLVLR